MTWTPGFDLVASMSHLFAGAAIVLAMSVWRRPWRGLLFLVWWVMAKEFVFDILCEGDTWAGSAWDALEYLLGGLAALGWYALSQRKPR